ncbi:MAG: hypothetical protein M1831_001511 [Alyxoria varia]|nr:MAG: hypothetical protein M1831_001511 [Alyxoria varia]
MLRRTIATQATVRTLASTGRTIKPAATHSFATEGHHGKQGHDHTKAESHKTPDSDNSTVKTAQVDSGASTASTATAEALGTTNEKTVAQMDEEMKAKLEGLSGEGGEAGLELENGKPVAMGRGTRANMFRVI